MSVAIGAAKGDHVHRHLDGSSGRLGASPGREDQGADGPYQPFESPTDLGRAARQSEGASL